MGKLNIAHHKSYHPYRRDNIERVRKDEEEARLKEEKEEGRVMLADSEARIERLRERAGLSGSKGEGKKKRVDDMKGLEDRRTEMPVGLPTTGGHINFFEDLESTSMAAAIRASSSKARAGNNAKTEETEKGFPLAPSEKDLNPWYSESSAKRKETPEMEEDKKRRDHHSKSLADPITSITHALSSRPSSSVSSRRPPPPPPSSQTQEQSRLVRESSERQRALALIERKRREAASMTPSTPGDRGGYGDMYNRAAVEDAHRGRDGGWGSRRWDEDERRGGRGRFGRGRQW